MKTQSQLFGARFEQTALRSEVQRAFALFLVFCAAGVIVLVRSLLSASGEIPLQRPAIVLLFGLIYEGAIALWLHRIIRSGKRPANWFWGINLIVECSLPTVGIVLLWNSGSLSPYQALTAPSMLFYPVFMLLSVLQLRPWLSFYSGVICGVEYAGLAGLVLMVVANESHAGRPPIPMLFTYPAALLILGAAAAFVAGRLRQHVLAGLAEAESRQRIEQELAAARRIQQGLLPKDHPGVRDFEIAGWSRPADETGGDYYDWQVLPDGKVAVSLADVTGHGIGPALVTAFCRAYVRATFQDQAKLDMVLERVNRLIAGDLSDGRFVTFVVALLTPGSGAVEILSAGHGPIMHYQAASRTVNDRNADSPPLGILPEMGFHAVPRIEMAVDDVLVLLTDGFFEWTRADGEQYGIERLKEMIIKAGDRPPAELIQAIRRDVEIYADGAPQADDLTAVIIRRVAGGSGAASESHDRR